MKFWEWLVIMLSLVIVILAGTECVWADYPGEYHAELIEIRDGDTFVVNVSTWLNTKVREPIRVRGIDTPEKHAKSLCERQLAAEATRHAEYLLKGRITLKNIKSRRTFDRAVADVYVDGINFANLMVLRGYARKCTKCKNGYNWCE